MRVTYTKGWKNVVKVYLQGRTGGLRGHGEPYGWQWSVRIRTVDRTVQLRNAPYAYPPVHIVTFFQTLSW